MEIMETDHLGHAVGPWERKPDAVPEGIVQNTVYQETTGTRIATVFGTEANARLIAAAPDLLDACQAALGLAEANEYDELPTYVQVRAAIAKAVGTEVLA